MRDELRNKQIVHLGNVSVSGTTAATSAFADIRGFNACTIMVVTNTVTDAGTAAGFTVTLQDSADTADASAATVTATNAVGGTNTVTVTSDSDDNKNAGGMAYLGSNRYVGISVVGTTGSDAHISVFAILDRPSQAKTTFVGTSVART